MKIKNKTDDWDKPDDRDLARASVRACGGRESERVSERKRGLKPQELFGFQESFWKFIKT